MDKPLVIGKEKTQICRLCLEKIIGIVGDELNSVKVQMLKQLTVDLPFEITNEQIICPSCAEKLEQTFNFKITCLNNENLVKVFHSCKNKSVLILEEVFPIPVLSDFKLKNEDTRVCRFCLKHFVMEKCTALDQMDKDIFLQDLIFKTVSEMDLSLTSEPVVCSECMEALQVLFNFIVGCFDANEIIRNYISSIEQDNIKSIDLHKVSDFMSNLRLESETSCNLNQIKAEKGDWNGDNIVCSTTSEQELPDEGTLSNEDDDKIGIVPQTKANPYFVQVSKVNSEKLYACHHCPHKTTIRASLILHLLVHKKSSEISHLKCDLCNFQTKWATSLRTHMLLHKDESELIIYKCDNCKYQSKYKKHLRRHMETHNKKKIQCDHCPFTSKNLKNLRTHCERDHNVKNNEKNDSKTLLKVKKGYKCAHCSYETLKSCRIKEHVIKHMKQSETSAYKCDLCNFQTKHRASLSRHNKIHKNKEERKPDKPK